MATAAPALTPDMLALIKDLVNDGVQKGIADVMAAKAASAAGDPSAAARAATALNDSVDDSDDEDEKEDEPPANATPKPRHSSLTEIPHTPRTNELFLKWKDAVDRLVARKGVSTSIMTENYKQEVMRIVGMSKSEWKSFSRGQAKHDDGDDDDDDDDNVRVRRLPPSPHATVALTVSRPPAPPCTS